MALESFLFLEETKKNIERNVGLSIDEMREMDLCEIEKYIEEKKRLQLRPIPEIYRRTRGSTFTAMGKILTKDNYENRVRKLLKKYL